MKQQRKEDLLHSFPPVPYQIEAQMEGRGARNFCVFLTNGHELFVRCYHRYTKGELVERQRYVFAKDGAVRYIYDEWAEKPWRIARDFREPQFTAKGYPYSFDNTYVILNADAYKQSDMRYSGVGIHQFYCPLLYLRLYVRHPNVEYLLKAGYRHLIEENQRSYWDNRLHIEINPRVNLKSNNLLKMLGLNRTEFKLLKGWEKLYDRYMQWREIFPKYKPEDILMIARVYGHERGTLEEHQRISGLSALRLARYLTEQDATMEMYSDYLNQCRQLRYDLSDTAISLPHDFHVMHSRLSGIIKYRADEALRETFRENYAKRGWMEYQSDGLFIRQPESMAEIVDEGSILCHCVGGYAERHAKGQTNILFLRRTSEPDKPFYTVEVSNDGRIRQCYGYKNNRAKNPKPDEIKAFEAQYQNYLSMEVMKHERTQRAVQQSA